MITPRELAKILYDRYRDHLLSTEPSVPDPGPFEWLDGNLQDRWEHAANGAVPYLARANEGF